MNIKKTKLSKAIYGVFFGKKKSSSRRKTRPKSSANITPRESEDHETSTPSVQENSRKKKYDLSHLHEQVSETEYITNLRLGRSWIFPQMVTMGFVKKRHGGYEFDTSKFTSSFHKRYGHSVQGRRQVWKLMKRNYAAIAQSNGNDIRAKWWTKELYLEILKWDAAITGKRTRGLNAEECSKIIRDAEKLDDYNQISTSIDWYDVNRMRTREGNSARLPNCFINAYLVDGTYHAMMTMIKVYNLRLKNDAGEDLSRDECITEVEKKTNILSSRELLAYCKEQFFDSEIFEYKKYK